MYFFYPDEIEDEAFSNGECAVTQEISGQRFLAATLPRPQGDATVTVHIYELLDDLYCEALNGRTIALVHILEPEPMEQRMVLIEAEEMANALGESGHIALYGIYFDTDKTDLKPESQPTLEEIAALLESDSSLSVLIVGHTDSQGTLEYNLDLSRRRAEAVMAALVGSYAVDPQRLQAAGVGMMAPAATNDTPEGRATNRRVELVKLD
jgi:outer membrane protein OmpA-like peptidoglycan-associated protein